MRSITRPLATAAASTLLVLSLAACGDGGDDEAGDDRSPSASATTSASEDASASASVSAGGSASGSASGGASLSAAPGAEDLCASITDIIKVVGKVQGPKITEAEWEEIQDAYGSLEDVDLPGASKEEKEGRDIAVDAITSMSHQDALKAFSGESSGQIPGVSAADSSKAEAFFSWAGKQCPTAAGPAATASVPEASVSAQ